MQIILENQDRFEPQVVDKALEDLNASMHRPLVSQEELDAAAEEANNQMAANGYNNYSTNEQATMVPQDMNASYENANGAVQNVSSATQDINDMLTGSPIDEYLK